MTDKHIKEQEEKQQYENDSNELPTNDIVAFNELRSCTDLHLIIDIVSCPCLLLFFSCPPFLL